MAAIRKANYDPARDPLAPFIGAFDSGEGDTGWIERHNETSQQQATRAAQAPLPFHVINPRPYKTIFAKF